MGRGAHPHDVRVPGIDRQRCRQDRRHRRCSSCERRCLRLVEARSYGPADELGRRPGRRRPPRRGGLGPSEGDDRLTTASADVVIVIAPDLREELPVLFLRLRAALLAGQKVIVLSPVETALEVRRRDPSRLPPRRPRTRRRRTRRRRGRRERAQRRRGGRTRRRPSRARRRCAERRSSSSSVGRRSPSQQRPSPRRRASLIGALPGATVPLRSAAGERPRCPRHGARAEPPSWSGRRSTPAVHGSEAAWGPIATTAGRHPRC